MRPYNLGGTPFHRHRLIDGMVSQPVFLFAFQTGLNFRSSYRMFSPFVLGVCLRRTL
jgi:hypothetical protein